MTPCTLCEQDFAPDELNRVSGLDLCGPCCRRSPERHLQRQQILQTHRTWSTSASSRSNSRSHHVEASMDLGEVDTWLVLRCEREHALHALQRLFLGEIEVGDALFDDMIFVKTNDREAVGALLANEGLQSAIMGLVGGAGSFRIDGPMIRATRSQGGPFSEEELQEFLLEAAAATIHIRRWALAAR